MAKCLNPLKSMKNLFSTIHLSFLLLHFEYCCLYYCTFFLPLPSHCRNRLVLPHNPRLFSVVFVFNTSQSILTPSAPIWLSVRRNYNKKHFNLFLSFQHSKNIPYCWTICNNNPNSDRSAQCVPSSLHLFVLLLLVQYHWLEHAKKYSFFFIWRNYTVNTPNQEKLGQNLLLTVQLP